MDRQPNSRVCACAVGLLLVGVAWSQSASAAPIKIVVPNELAAVEGDIVFEVGGGVGFRHQQLALASEFAALPATHRRIVGAYLRPDASLTTPATSTYGDLTLRYSTTSRGPGELSTVFDENLGDDLTTVHSGPLTVSTEATGPVGGPRGFDYYFPLQTPFEYDPAQGNLLLETISMSGVPGSLPFDGFSSSSAIAVVGGPSASSGDPLFGGFVGQFVIVPEPSIVLLGVLGVIGLAVHRCRSCE